jgi:protocadherin-16/23
VFLGADVGTVLTAVTANDVDTNPALTYGFSTDSDSDAEATGLGVFSIDRFSGKITLVKRLDFETRREYRLRVTASDTAHTARTVLTIRVTDVNDNPPIFMKSSYQASLPGECRLILISALFSSSNFVCSGTLHFCTQTLKQV